MQMGIRYAHSYGRPSTYGLISLLGGLTLGLCATAASADPGEKNLTAADRGLRMETINAELSLTDSTLVSLQMDSAPGVPLSVAVPIAGQLRSLELVPHSVRSPDYELRVQLPDGSYVKAKPGPVRTFRGQVAGIAGSSVAASLNDDGLLARIILPDGANWWVEPLHSKMISAAWDEYVVYRDDSIVPSGGDCIALEPPGGVAAQEVPKRDVPAEDVFIAELGIDTDYAYYQLFRNEPDPIAAVEASVNELINTINIQFERDVGIKHVISALIVRTTIDDPYSGLDPTVILNQFRDHWNLEQSHIRRDLAQLLTPRDFAGSTIGIAWVGQVCANYAYSVVQSSCCNTFACKTDLSAHELGHIWGAHHCGYDGPDDPDDCAPACPDWTMNCTITCSNQFHEVVTQPDILTHRDTRSCLVEGDELRRIHVLSDVDTVTEGTVMSFAAVADFRYSNDEDVTADATWFVNRPQAGSVDANGVFTASEVDGNTCVVVSASYTYSGVTRTGDKTILIIDTNTPLSILDSNPPDGAIDARQPFKPDGTGPGGWNSFEITFNGDACLMAPEDFDIATENRAEPMTTLLEVEHFGLRSVRLVFDNIIETGAWTTVTHLESGEVLRVGSLPGDVNNNGTADPTDILELIRSLKGQIETPLSPWQGDLDRSGQSTAADLLRLIDLLNGAGGYTTWNGASLP